MYYIMLIAFCQRLIFGIGVFPLIAIRGSETLTVGIGVFPLIVIRGSFIVFSLVVLLFVMSVLYQVDRPLSTPIRNLILIP